MICLICGAENTYGAESCVECSQPFNIFPPYIKSNHVCQLQSCITEYLEGQLEKEDLQDMMENFKEIFTGFENKWRLKETPAARRLGTALSERFGDAVGEIDRGYASLQKALELMGEFAAEGSRTPDGEKKLLEEIHQALGAFFSITCSGCGWIIKEMETLDKKDLQIGAILNIKWE
jgi:hypothetical protein